MSERSANLEARGRAIGPRIARDAAGMLRVIAMIDTVLAAPGCASAYAVEKKLKWPVRARCNDSGPKTPGLISKYRTGEHLPAVPTLRQLESSFPLVRPVSQSCLWGLLRHGLRGSAIDFWAALESLDDDAFRVTHASLFPESRSMRLTSLGLARPTTRTLQELVALGSVDAIAALVLLGTVAFARVGEECRKLALRHVPPALAVFSETPTGSRVAPLVFACLRQTVLDDARIDGKRLRLDDYDIRIVGHMMPPVLPRQIMDTRQFRPRGTGTLKTFDYVREWIASNLAPLECEGRSANSCWAPSLSPASHCQRLAREGLGFHETVLREFASTLKCYWDHEVAAH